MAELIKEHAGAEMHPSMPVEDARKIAEEHDVPIEDEWGAGKIMAEVYDETCEAKLIEPTFVMDHPREVSPLARAHRDDPTLTERFEAVIAGRELANAYSELNDPVDQAQRFEDEAKAKAAGDEEAEEPDDDYVRALEYGLPPTGGLGIGLDRLVMLIADASAIRDVILFPTMRPEGGTIRDAGPAPGEAGAIPTADSLRAGDGRPAEPAKAPPAEPPEAVATPSAAPEPAPSAPVPAAPSGRVRALAWATALLGIVSLIPTIPVIHDDLGIEPLIDRDGRAISHVASVLIGAVLLLVARQLARRKRTAWQIAVGLFALGDDRPPAQGTRPDRGSARRRDAHGARVVAARLRRSDRPGVAAHAGAVRSPLPARGARVRDGRAAGRERQDPADADRRRGPRDDVRGPGRDRRAIHVREQAVR